MSCKSRIRSWPEKRKEAEPPAGPTRCKKGAQRALGPPRGPSPTPPKARKSALLILLSLIRATSLPGSTPQAPGHAVARDHALLPSRDGRFVARARRADIAAAVRFESYPRFIKGGFQDYKSLGIKRSTADSKHVPSPRSRLLGTTP